VSEETARHDSELPGEVYVGRYRLKRMRSGALWLEAETGEGMECNAATETALDELLGNFWKENF
jgi:hypothetical protein